MNMRIAFCGAAGTGKTTLAEWLAGQLGLPLNPVGSRSVAQAMGFDNPYDVDKAGKRGEFQKRLLDEKRAWENANESFVTDRALIDNITYTSLHGVETITQDMIDQTFEGFARYTRVFFCPMAAFHKTGNDPARIHSRAYHLIFETMIRGWLDDYGSDTYPRVSTIWIPRLEGRKAFILEELKKQ